MSKRNSYEDENKGNRVSPYDDMTQEEALYDEDMMEDEDSYSYGDDAYDDGYEEYDGGQDEEEEVSFLSSGKGRLLLGVVAALLVVLLALLAFMFLRGKKDQSQLPSGEGNPPVTQQATTAPGQEPGPIVFAPSVTQSPTDAPEADEPTQAPVIVISETQAPTPKPTPTSTPDPTATPLPIIMSNTPTPSPTPTATPTPSPSPSPTPSPKPTATPQVDLANGVTNRDAKLRESASSSGKIKKTVKKGETVTIHEALLGKDGKTWYALTVDDLVIDGYMRDYVVNVDGEIVAPTPTPKPTAEPSDEMTVSVGDAVTPQPEAVEGELAVGKTNRDANVRKIMNGKVLVTLRKNKAVSIVDVRLDKKGNTWYEVVVSGTGTRGFVRDYVIDVEDGVELEIPEPAEAPAKESEEDKAKEPAQTEEVQQPEAPEAQGAANAIGEAKTNRDANVRVKPQSGAKLVRQLSKGNKLNIFAKYEVNDQIWYEVATESGKTRGFVRDYVINVIDIDKDAPAQTYVEETEEEAEEADPGEEKQASAPRTSRFQYAGNKESKVFHELACDLLPSSSKNLVYMESRTYALNTGYKPCESCKP